MADGAQDPLTLDELLKVEKLRLLSWLSLVSATGAFRSCRSTRRLLSSYVTALAVFSVYPREETNDGHHPQRQRLAQRTRARLPHSPLDGPLRMCLKVCVSEVPIRSASLVRTLQRCIPMVDWSSCKQILLKCQGSLHALDPLTFTKVAALSEADELEFLVQPHGFRSLERLTLSISTVSKLPPDLSLPQVRRLKVVCHDSQFDTETVASVYRVFPGLKRLHLAVAPTGLLPLCGPGFKAPPDFRISLVADGKKLSLDDGEAPQTALFVASHLMSLPFSWGGALFENVVRLQMTELCQDHKGLAGDQLAELLRSMPQLRRLGTVSLRMFQLLDLTRKDCRLEELVLVMSMMDVTPVFRTFLSIEQARGRTSLQRMAVHLQAWDGVCRPTVEVEKSLIAGWLAIASSLLRPAGTVVFSFGFGHRQLGETAIAQLAWYDPLHFCVDWQDYESDGKLPGSTALERPLPFPSIEERTRPRGTLVAGSLRPGTGEEKEELQLPGTPSSVSRARLDKSKPFGPTLSTGGGGVSARSHSSSPGCKTRTRSRSDFASVTLLEAYDHLSKLKETEDRKP